MVATLLIFPTSSKLSKTTHLFIIIDHINPSAAFDNSYRGLAELRTWPDVSNAGRQAGTVAARLPSGKTSMFFPSCCLLQTICRGMAEREESRWSLCRDTDEEVWVFICLVDGSGNPLSTVQVNHLLQTLAFCTLQALGKHLFISCIFHISNLRMNMLAVALTTFLQQCNKALLGEPFSITISYGSASLLPVVDVNGVLLVAAAPL